MLRVDAELLHQGFAHRTDKLFTLFVVPVQHLPVIFVALTVTGAVILGSVLKTVPFVLFGTYVSWFYLRFFQSKSEAALK